MKMRRKKVISGAMLSSTLRKFLKKYVSSRPLFLVSYKLLFPIRPSYVLIVFGPPQIVSTAILGREENFCQTWKILASDGPRHLEKFFSSKIFFLKSPRLCLNRVCPASNSIHSDFEADRSWSPNLENFRPRVPRRPARRPAE